MIEDIGKEIPKPTNPIPMNDNYQLEGIDFDVKCDACAKMHDKKETMIRKRCIFEETIKMYCDETCFKWRYYDPKHGVGRYYRFGVTA